MSYQAELYDVMTPASIRGDAEWYPPDIRRLLTTAGFRSLQMSGAFDGRAFQSDTDELVIEAREDELGVEPCDPERVRQQ